MSCHRCKGFGCIVAIEKASGYTFAFQCTCGSRRDANKNFPQWTESLAKVYSTDFSPITAVKKPEVVEKPIEPPKPQEKPPQKDYKVLAADPHAYDVDDDDLPF